MLTMDAGKRQWGACSRQQLMAGQQVSCCVLHHGWLSATAPVTAANTAVLTSM
jgi:hypothetical protein